MNKQLKKIIPALLILAAIVLGKDAAWVHRTARVLEQAIPAESQSSQPATLSASADELRVHFIDVGQGDCILAESDGHFLLVDAGEYNQADKVISYLQGLGADSLDYMVGTHPHSDHIGALADIMQAIPVQQLMIPDITHNSYTFEHLLDTVQAEQVPVSHPRPGETYTLGNASFTIIAPVRETYQDNLNDWSIGILLEYGENRFVMCGDCEKDAEADICKNGIDISADVLKVDHHGSSTSTSKRFINAVHPEYAVIQCAQDNDYGHPHQETMELLEKHHVTVYRTDLNGTITVTSDGTHLTWETER